MNKPDRSKAYSAPKLVIYGDMVKFTASGTQVAGENPGANMAKMA